MGYFQKHEEKKRLRKLYEQTWHSYGCGAYWNDRKGRYIRYYPYSSSHGKGIKKYYQRVCNRKIRRAEDTAMKGSLYKRAFDLWWTMT